LFAKVHARAVGQTSKYNKFGQIAPRNFSGTA
jgi:hypothetical protein